MSRFDAQSARLPSKTGFCCVAARVGMERTTDCGRSRAAASDTPYIAAAPRAPAQQRRVSTRDAMDR